MEHQGYYKAALYCRLSLDDGKVGDSSSIQTQKVMLEQYCKQQDISIANFYVDDGYSGLNYTDPISKECLGI